MCEAYVIPFLFGSFFTVCHPNIDVHFLKCFFCYFGNKGFTRAVLYGGSHYNCIPLVLSSVMIYVWVTYTTLCDTVSCLVLPSYHAVVVKTKC